jgi:hypothetical protein
MDTIRFSRNWPAELDEDETVVRHELGHALVWLDQGNVVERICFTRTANLLLRGVTKVKLPDGWSEARLRKERPEQLAERILAGEIAAREYNELAHGEICTDLVLLPNSELGAVLTGQSENPDDDIKALFLAHEAAGLGWYVWLCERHAAARARVLTHWAALENAAENVLADLPLCAGEEFIIRGPSVARLLEVGPHSAV